MKSPNSGARAMTKPHDIVNKLRERLDAAEDDLERFRNEIVRLRMERDECLRKADHVQRIANLETEMRKHYEAQLAVSQTELAILRDELRRDI